MTVKLFSDSVDNKNKSTLIPFPNSSQVALPLERSAIITARLPIVSLITLINIRITPLIDNNQDGVRAFTDTTFTFETDPAFNFEMILRWTITVRPMEGEDTTQSHYE